MKNTAKQLKEIAKSASVHRVALPEKETLNEFYQNYASDGIVKLIGEALTVSSDRKFNTLTTLWERTCNLWSWFRRFKADGRPWSKQQLVSFGISRCLLKHR